MSRRGRGRKDGAGGTRRLTFVGPPLTMRKGHEKSRRLRPGDRVGVGRSLLLFGSEQEIAARVAALSSIIASQGNLTGSSMSSATIQAQTLASQFDHDLNLDLNPQDKVTAAHGNL